MEQSLRNEGNIGESQPNGRVGLRVIRNGRNLDARDQRGLLLARSPKVKTSDLLHMFMQDGLPRMSQEKAARRYHFKNLAHMTRGLKTVIAAHVARIPTHLGDLRLTLTRNSDGRVIDLGLVSLRVVTDNGVALIVDALDNTLANADVRYHGIGTGTNAENATDSALQTELTTQYNPDNTRATGTFSQPAANQSRSVATNTVDASAAVTEHGVFTQAATGGGTLLDRSQFSAVNLANGDSLQSTYTLTLTSGG